MRSIRTYREVANPASEDIVAQVTEQGRRLQERLAGVRQVVVIASGKGGVGKSALTANLAAALSRAGRPTGALDADLNGPSLGRMLGVSGGTLHVRDGLVDPAVGAGGVWTVSTDLLLPDDAPLRWRNPVSPENSAGPAFLYQSMYEGSVVRELLADVRWGELDFLLIDAPPGTDKLDRLLELLPAPPVLILVTTPSEVTRRVVARSAFAARELAIRPGLVINMAGQVCQHCGKVTSLFDDYDPGTLAAETGLEVWAEIPFETALARTTDRGRPLVLDTADSPAVVAIRALAARLTGRLT